MQKNIVLFVITGFFLFPSCTSTENNANETTAEERTVRAGQSAVEDAESSKNVVGIAAGSEDHTTLVAAVKAADLVDALSNVGPFTVFAPTNAAFEELPDGTVENLLKPEQKSALRKVLQYHVFIGVLPTDNMEDGQVLGQVSGGNATLGVKDGIYTINGAKIVASIPASNGMVHVIDGVLLPPSE